MPARNKKKAQNFSVLKPRDFLHDLTQEAKSAKKRLWVQAMYFKYGDTTKTLVEIFQNTGKNVDKKLHADWFSLMLMPKNAKGDLEQKIFKKLQDSNVKITLTNPPTLIERVIPYKGRNHMKMTIIDDIVYVGGINFSDNDFTYVDFMVKIKDAKIASVIADLFTKIEKNLLKEDMKIRIDEEITLLVDCGKPGKSIILDHAIRLAKQAGKSIYFVNQFAPDGALVKSLHSKYKESIKVQLIVPEKNEFGKIFTMIHKWNQAVMWLKNMHVPMLFCKDMIHAKLLVIDENTAFFGSHNLTQTGVAMGTGEIMLQLTNKRVVRNLLNFYKELYARVS